jgi:hypothetical protein
MAVETTERKRYSIWFTRPRNYLRRRTMIDSLRLCPKCGSKMKRIGKALVSSYHMNLEIERAALGIEFAWPTNYEKCALTSCSLSREALFLQSSEKEGSVTMLCKKLKSSVRVTPCFRSYSIFLHTFIILPYFL